jgi:parallel beta-helix repeat protein
VNVRTIKTITPWIGVCVVICIWSVVGLAHHNGPEFYVDARNPVEDDQDGDYHFRTINAALNNFPEPQDDDTLVIAPGVYVESLVISVDGLMIKTSGSADQTIIQGAIKVDAERVELNGFSVDAGGQAVGISVEMDDAHLVSLIVYGAETGVLLSGPGPLKRILLENNRIYNNQIGLMAENMRDSALVENTFDANIVHGGVIENGYDLTLTQNRWTLNGEFGLHILNGRYIELEDEVWLNNASNGIVLEAVSRLKLNRGEAHQNGGFGILLTDAHLNEINQISFDRNTQAGLKIEEASQSNVIQGSNFIAHSTADSAGIWVDGPVFDNDIVGNTFEQNRVGILLTSTHEGAPGSNRMTDNTIIQSTGDGVRAEATEGDNLFADNTLANNNGNGIYWVSSQDWIEANTVSHSGQSGLALNNSTDLDVVGNVVKFNRASGLSLQTGAFNNRIKQNFFNENLEQGISLHGDEATRLIGNEFSSNQRNGLHIELSTELTLEDNLSDHNGEYGVWINQTDTVMIHNNKVTSNNTGGVFVQQTESLLFEQNAIEDNLHLGLWVVGSDVDAKRNWWGHAMGPAGFFEGRGNAVVGLRLVDIAPWLPDRPDRLIEPTVEALILDAVGYNQTLEVDIRDRSRLQLEMTGLGVDEQGRRMPVSLGVVVLAEYDLAEQSQSVEAPTGTKALYSIQVGGLSEGQSHLVINYDGLDISNADDLALYQWQGERWNMLPGATFSLSKQVTGELSTSQLKPAVIALIEGNVSTASVPFRADASNAKTSVDRAEEAEQIAVISQPNTGIDMTLIAASLFVLGLGRVARRYQVLDRLQSILP